MSRVAKLSVVAVKYYQGGRLVSGAYQASKAGKVRAAEASAAHVNNAKRAEAGTGAASRDLGEMVICRLWIAALCREFGASYK